MHEETLYRACQLPVSRDTGVRGRKMEQDSATGDPETGKSMKAVAALYS